MRIAHKRIRVPEKYLGGIPVGGNFYVGLTDLQNFSLQLSRIGFGLNYAVGQQVLPSVIGKVTKFNANGGHVIRRDLPKETVFREAELIDWHGNLHTVDIPYQRYPRDPIPAPEVEVLIRNGANNNMVLTSPILANNAQDMDDVKHVINLFLEMFGECEILQENLLPAFNIPVTRLNWEVLPAGNYPWQVLAPRVLGVINAVNAQRRAIIEDRVRRISSYTPNFVAVGTAGFKGYIVFGFSNKNFFVLESIYTGNATYILGNDWQQVSQLTKEEIIGQNLHRGRIVHAAGWDAAIDNLLQ